MKHSLKIDEDLSWRLTWGTLKNEPVLNWLNYEIGSQYNVNSNWQWDFVTKYLFFRYEEDKVKFILRWL